MSKIYHRLSTQIKRAFIEQWNDHDKSFEIILDKNMIINFYLSVGVDQSVIDFIDSIGDKPTEDEINVTAELSRKVRLRELSYFVIVASECKRAISNLAKRSYIEKGRTFCVNYYSPFKSPDDLEYL